MSAVSVNLLSSNLISCDGGGVRGVVTAVMLQELEGRLRKPLTELFPFFTGTSVGSLIATAMVCPNDEGKPKFKASELCTLFKENIPKVFSTTWGEDLRTVDGLISSKYSPEGLEDLAQRTLGETPLSKALSTLFVPTTEARSQGSFLFASDEPSQKEVLMRQAIRASAAAPTYFPEYSLKIGENEYTFCDGGMWANDPSLAGYLEMKERLKESPRTVILSLGTGTCTTPLPPSSKSWGIAEWAPKILDLTFAAGASAVQNQLKLVVKGTPEAPQAHTYCRLEPILDPAHMNLDDTSPENIRYLEETTKKFLYDNALKVQKICDLILPPSTEELK